MADVSPKPCKSWLCRSLFMLVVVSEVDGAGALVFLDNINQRTTITAKATIIQIKVFFMLLIVR